MAAENEGSVTRWISGLRGGDLDEPARRLWARYFDQLARLAGARLRASPRGTADGEDVALSAFDSFFQGAAAGRFPDLSGRDDLWRLLVTITARKASNSRRHEAQLKRGGGRVFGEAALSDADPDAADALAQVMSREPSPEFAAMVLDECRRLLNGLRDDTLRQVALMRMEGYSNEQVSERLGCGLRTVERKLDLIRKTWLAQGPS